MNHPMMSSTGIDQDSHLAHDNSYPSNQWGEVNNFAHMTTMTSSYPDTYYMAHANHHGLPSESIGGHMAPPPVPHQHMHHHNIYPSQLPSPLIIPTQHAPPPVQWPSMHTNPPQHSYSTPPVAIPPASAPVRQHPRLPTINTSQPRRTLTDEDRRNMCKFHEENPTVKQAEIGIKFGVERR
ncbi:hypothetical protein F4780DRAFT_667888 [Xylariomycetidae sp. FL0641]|nr:hypothetical protein F4780DRAFT_667888 [Xylariomycetidae sp. FL0641]